MERQTSPIKLWWDLKHIFDEVASELEKRDQRQDKEKNQSKWPFSRIMQSNYLRIVAIWLVLLSWSVAYKNWNLDPLINKFTSQESLKFDKSIQLITMRPLSNNRAVEIWSNNVVAIYFEIRGWKYNDFTLEWLEIFDWFTKSWFNSETISNIKIFEKKWKEETLLAHNWGSSIKQEWVIHNTNFDNLKIVIPKKITTGLVIGLSLNNNPDNAWQQIKLAIQNLRLKNAETWELADMSEIDFTPLVSPRMLTLVNRSNWS